MTNAVTANSTGTVVTSVISNLGNPYGADFVVPAHDPRPPKART